MDRDKRTNRGTTTGKQIGVFHAVILVKYVLYKQKQRHEFIIMILISKTATI